MSEIELLSQELKNLRNDIRSGFEATNLKISKIESEFNGKDGMHSRLTRVETTLEPLQKRLFYIGTAITGLIISLVITKLFG